MVAAYDKSPRFGGKQVATILLTHDPYVQTTDLMLESDYEAEGFRYLEEHGLLRDGIAPRVYFLAWKAAKMPLWVVRFEVCP